MAAYRRVYDSCLYDSCRLQADCQEPGSDPEPYLYLFNAAVTINSRPTRLIYKTTYEERKAFLEYD